MRRELSIFTQAGLTLTDVIPGTPGLHPGLEVTYRPLLNGPERRAFEETPAARRDAAEAALMLDRLDSFRPAPGNRPEGEPLRMTEEQLGLLWPNLYFNLLNRILGYVGPSLAEQEKNSSGASGSNSPTAS
jgi:hypothetical protein